MYKILVIVKETGSFDGGRAIAMETISFDNLAPAQKAFAKLYKNAISGMTVFALFE